MSAVPSSLTTLPSIADARLPAAYENATRALAECSSIDECQQWADKAQAMASYARQAKDETLRKMADRIQARAIRRCGELLRQVPRSPGVRTDLQPQEGDLPRFERMHLCKHGMPYSGADCQYCKRTGRTQAASDAGLSEHQRKTALRVAAVPSADFARQVESDEPPTVTALAKQGTVAKPQPLVDLGGIPAADYARASEAMGTLRRFAEYCQAQEPARIAAAFKPHEVAAVRKNVAIVDAWLDQFVVHLQG